MDAHHLSASSANAFLACPAQWRARYVHEGGDMSGEAANRGTAFHLALERFIQSSDHLDPDGFGHLRHRWAEAWDEVMRQPRGSMEYLSAENLLRKWWDRQDWSDREAINTEVRREFMLAGAKMPIPFVYIIDRLDRTPSGLEVVDYKSGRFMLNHDGLRNDLQAISYATAVWLDHRDQRRYWVTFDYLQGDPIGVAFSPEQCEAHYGFLCEVADSIAASDGEEERLNSQCRFCDRKLSCGALARHMDAGGYLGLNTATLVDKRVELTHAAAAIKTGLDEIDGLLIPIFEGDDELDFLRGNDASNEITMGSGSRRFVDMDVVRKHLTDEDLASYAKLGVKELEAIITEKALGEGWGDTEVARLKKAIQPGRTRPAIRIIG